MQVLFHWRTFGSALGRTASPRDVGLSPLTGFGEEDQFIDRLPKPYEPRMSGAREFALARRVLLLQSRNALATDVTLSALL
jgi:hypothetical protein